LPGRPALPCPVCPCPVILLFHLGTSISRPGPVRPSRSWNQDRHLDGRTDGQTHCYNYTRDIYQCWASVSSHGKYSTILKLRMWVYNPRN
jgi:hypothetical protein